MRGNAHGGFGGAGRGNGSPERTTPRPGPTLLRLPELPPNAAPTRHHAADRPAWGESHSRLGRHRWKVERSLAWLLANRRLTVRYERRADILTAFLHLACALICTGKLRPSCSHR